MKSDGHAWVEVRNCVWLQEAQVVRSVLDAAGIEAMIPDEYTLGAHPFYGLALGGVRVLVRAGDWSRAVEFLDAAPGNPEDSSDG